MRLLIIVLILALSLSACSQHSSKDRASDTDVVSNNDTRLISVQVDARDFSTTEIDVSTCPKALAVGIGSCNVEVP